ncbi:hypothetical protein KI387_032298, partial [Taxus chinensis]
MNTNFAHPMIPPSAEFLRKQLECLQSVHDSCPPWDTARKMALSKELRELTDKYIRTSEAEQARLQEHEDSHPDESFETVPIRPPYQQRIRQRQIPTRGRSGAWRGRGERNFQQRTYEHGQTSRYSDPASRQIYKEWRKARIELLEKVIEKATTEFTKLLEEEEKEKNDPDKDLDGTYLDIASDESKEVCTISCTQNPFIAIVICIPHIKKYMLDAMIDTGAEISLLR